MKTENKNFWISMYQTDAVLTNPSPQRGGLQAAAFVFEVETLSGSPEPVKGMKAQLQVISQIQDSQCRACPLQPQVFFQDAASNVAAGRCSAPYRANEDMMAVMPIEQTDQAVCWQKMDREGIIVQF